MSLVVIGQSSTSSFGDADTDPDDGGVGPRPRNSVSVTEFGRRTPSGPRFSVTLTRNRGCGKPTPTARGPAPTKCAWWLLEMSLVVTGRAPHGSENPGSPGG